jgi:DNA-directed RNA polymerase I, II, and III subunit RPABC1
MSHNPHAHFFLFPEIRMSYDRVHKLHRAYATVRAMLAARGYSQPEELDLPTVQTMVEQNEFPFSFVSENAESEPLLVFFPDDASTARVGVGPIRDFYVKKMVSDGVARAILVVRRGLTPPAFNAVKDLFGTHGVRIDTFDEQELQFDLMRHEKVPEHTVLSADQKAQTMRRLRMAPDQFMVLQFSDPVARYLGVSMGDLVQIRRYTPTAIRLAYRIVQDTKHCG